MSRLQEGLGYLYIVCETNLTLAKVKRHPKIGFWAIQTVGTSEIHQSLNAMKMDARFFRKLKQKSDWCAHHVLLLQQ